VVVGAAIGDVVAAVSGEVLVIGNIHKTAVFGGAVAGAVGDGVGQGAQLLVLVLVLLWLLWLSQGPCGCCGFNVRVVLL
jgi:hypothetical protein